ncbi:hypothetical protein O6H91_02G005700 [Diphasiastrum complanatum]|uniref:Uncharacterized protein n=2 Tax=Diphasiastrum complanatum TaxID=34168 RepID=A0ACC2ECN0_DIPCM|nr:hypothetical protein O6H91_02G005700 [Diphasiastrum complanatum]KAJ7564171.1 hypothetical protein O6H91_02G005700 [Diphasiastrum complanatum]
MARREGSFSGWLQRVRRTGEYSDVTVKANGEDFCLHMLPLLNGSSFFRDLPAPSSTHSRVVDIPNLPGGSEAFSFAADFCYLIKPTYSFHNVGPIRAVAEFLGMNDLMDSTKKFLYTNVFCHWRSCVSFLHSFKIVHPPVDDYIDSRCIKVITSACTKAFLDAKHVSAPISLSVMASGSWQPSPCQTLTEMLATVASLPDEYMSKVMDTLVEAEVNLHIKCRQGRHVRAWLDYLINDQCRTDRARSWVVLLLAKMLLKNAPQTKPWLELSSQYWCSLLERAAQLVKIADAIPREHLISVISVLESKIGASLHELDDYIQAFNFEPETLLSLARHFVQDGNERENEIEEVAAEVDGCLWSFAENLSISADTFISIFSAFPPWARRSHDMLYPTLEKMLIKGSFSAEEKQNLWKLVDCSKLTPGVNERAMNNPSFLCQPHVLESVLQRHSEELGRIGDEDRQNLRHIMQKVIKASLKLLEENSRRSKEILELQKQYAALLGGRICMLRDSCENSPDLFKSHHHIGLHSVVRDEDTCSHIPARHSTSTLNDLMLKV